MLEITEKHRFNYEYCMFLHDLLVELIKSGESSEIFNVSLDINHEQSKFLKDNNLFGDDLLNWMESNGFHEEKKELYFRQLFVALLSDFCLFTFESLTSARKHKMTVAYALLRKPLKDNLLFLEWLAGNSKELIEDFDSQDGLLKIASEKIDSLKKIEIIENAMSISAIGKWINPSLIYELRYDKKSLYGFEPLFQKANHLITNNKHYKTEYSNMNFIFSDSIAIETQLDHYFSILPIILFNTFHVIENTILKFSIRVFPERDKMVYLRTFLGLLLSIKKIPFNVSNDFQIENIIKPLFENVICFKCSNKLDIKNQDYLRVYKTGKIKCKYCKKKVKFIDF